MKLVKQLALLRKAVEDGNIENVEDELAKLEDMVPSQVLPPLSEHERATRLARAVSAFAEWHEPGYEPNWTTPARQAVGMALWDDVSGLVHELVGIRPKNPCSGE